jgi:hypothetical protein
MTKSILSIINSDKAVYVNGFFYSNLPLNTVPTNVNALQWDGVQGHIEFTDGIPNQEITELPTWANDAKDEWNVAKIEAEKEAARPKIDAKELATSKSDQEYYNMPTSMKMVKIRAERNRRLDICDWTQLPDAPTSIDKEGWAVYRQALRDLTDSPTLNVDNVVFPVPPSYTKEDVVFMPPQII